MDIEVELTERGGRFVARKDGVEYGEMTFKNVDDGVINVHHTGVEDIAKGMGVGKQLFHAMVEWSRTESKTVIPTCPFVAARFDKEADTRDVLAE